MHGVSCLKKVPDTWFIGVNNCMCFEYFIEFTSCPEGQGIRMFSLNPTAEQDWRRELPEWLDDQNLQRPSGPLYGIIQIAFWPE